MPNYDYKCKNCSYEFEEFQRMSDPSLVTCPQCKTDNLVRIIYGGAVHFKGSGFYLTDYKKKSSSEASSSTSSETGAKKEEKKSEVKSETKSASSTPAKGDAK